MLYKIFSRINLKLPTSMELTTGLEPVLEVYLMTHTEIKPNLIFYIIWTRLRNIDFFQ